MQSAVIFDMDGVLVDSYAAHREAWRAMGAADDLPFDETKFRTLFGRSDRSDVSERSEQSD